MKGKCKAIILLAMGVLFFLGTLGVWPEFTFMKYWPLFLVLWGLHDTFCGCNASFCHSCGDGKHG